MASLHSGYTLNVALVYQDALTAHRAGQVRDRIAVVAGKQGIRCTKWKIGDLRQRKVFSEGVAALTRADVIVVSLYEVEQLPATFYLWVNVWLQERAGLAGMLVALVGRASGAPVNGRQPGHSGTTGASSSGRPKRGTFLLVKSPESRFDSPRESGRNSSRDRYDRYCSSCVSTFGGLWPGISGVGTRRGQGC